MVIERALEKLRQANAGKHGEELPRHARRASDAARLAPKPTFVHLSSDPEKAERHRIMLPNSPMSADARAAAAYRMARTRLLHQVQSNNWSRIAITSPSAGDGKSVTALNLALNFARDATSDVFLIDLDLRNPSIAGYLGIQPPHELVSYFAGRVTPADVFFSLEGVENLALAGSVTPTDLASELIATARLDDLFDHIRVIAPNPLVLLDLPPILVTDEALLIAPRVDATLLVVAQGKTERESLVRAVELLSEFKCAGVILNRASEHVGGDDSYYYRYRDT